LDDGALDPLISIVTVSLDDASGLRSTVGSLQEQTYQAFEWLVVDGGSTDGTLALIEALGPAIDHWSSEPDRGVYDAMNRGLDTASGDYVMFLNAGDRLADPEALQAVVEALIGQPGLDLLFAATMLELPSGRQIRRPPRHPIHWLRYGLPAYHQATVIRRSAHLSVPYDLGLLVSADYGAIAGLCVRGARTARLDRALAVRRCHPDSLSEQATATRFADFRRVQRTVLGLAWPRVGLALLRLAVMHVAYRILRATAGTDRRAESA
jgi:putative colanic acid biosynthesis glycosyltransferase